MTYKVTGYMSNWVKPSIPYFKNFSIFSLKQDSSTALQQATTQTPKSMPGQAILNTLYDT